MNLLKRGLIVGLIILAGCVSYPAETPVDYRLAEDSVVILTHEPGLTSGVLLTEDGYVLSCAHGGAPKYAYAKLYYDDMDMPLIVKCENIEVVYLDTTLDVGIYKITDERKFACAAIADKAPVQGEDVFSIGTPLGAPYYISWGKLIDLLYNSRTGLGYLLHSCSGNQGNSGGPVFNMKGEIVGINNYMYAAIPTFSGYVPLIDGMIAVDVTTLSPGIWGIIEVHRVLKTKLDEFAIADKHLEELNN